MSADDHEHQHETREPLSARAFYTRFIALWIFLLLVLAWSQQLLPSQWSPEQVTETGSLSYVLRLSLDISVTCGLLILFLVPDWSWGSWLVLAGLIAEYLLGHRSPGVTPCLSVWSLIPFLPCLGPIGHFPIRFSSMKWILSLLILLLAGLPSLGDLASALDPLQRLSSGERMLDLALLPLIPFFWLPPRLGGWGLAYGLIWLAFGLWQQSAHPQHLLSFTPLLAALVNWANLHRFFNEQSKS